MENRNTVIEVIQGDLSNRNKVSTLDIYNKIEQKNMFGKEMYRSYYSFDSTFGDYVLTNKTVKGFDGLAYADTITIDLDKGEHSDDKFQEYLRYCLNELFDFDIRSEDINLWFSGKGYHIELQNVFGFQPSKNLHTKVKSTMQEYFTFGDNIYDKTRIIRSKWSLNPKTKLYKVFIPLQHIWDLSYEEICKIAKSKKAYDSYVKSHEGFYNTLNVDKIVEPYLQKYIITSPQVVQSNITKTGDTTSVVTCVQHIFNEGPTQGSRNTKIMRMSSSYKRAGIPYLVTLNGMINWADGQLDAAEVTRTVSNIYEENYMYGCQDIIMAEYCDPKCIHFKRKDYMMDIKDVIALEDFFKEYIENDMSKKSVDMKDVFDCDSFVFKPGELIVVSGDTGMGKSAFVQNIVTKAQKDCLFLSLEMNEILTFRRFVQIAMRQNAQWVINQYKSDPSVSFQELLGHIKIVTIAPDIEAVKKIVAQHEPNILVVDTTDELQASGNRSSDIEKQNNIIDGLKAIAQRNHTIVIAVHHVNKVSASQGVIGLHSLKGSTNVVQKADKVLVVKGNRNEIHRVITSEKSRDEGRFELIAEFDYNTFTFNKKIIV
tara:strand:- start:164 stop:1957 length:1794 start_codon:yes stop_codon:yes gene_type:complete